MKKKFVVLGIIVLLIAILIGIYLFFSNREKDYTTVVLDKTTYELIEDEYEYDIHYKIDNNFKKVKLPMYVSYYSNGVKGSPYFLIKIYRYTDKSMNEVIKYTVGKYDKKKNIKINDLEYTVVNSKDILNRNIKAYYHKQNNHIYVFYFNARIDISKLEKAFLHNIVYEDNLDTDR